MADDADQQRAVAQVQRWRALKISIILAGFGAATASGLILYFVEPFVGNLGDIGTLHWIIGIAVIAPYSLYQWPHFLHNRNKSDSLHYKAGLWTFFSIVAMVITGAILIFVPYDAGIADRMVDIGHLFSSFVFIMLLGGHLVLVGKITLERAKNAGQSESAAAANIYRLVLWIPVFASGLFFLAVWLLP